MTITIEIANEQDFVPLDEERIRDAVRGILGEASIAEAIVSVAVVDDSTIGRLHGKYLGDDSPTDVISFVLERGESSLEGEVIVSGERAAAAAPQYGWPAEDELLLYVIHGMLHLAGYDDTTPETREEMRRREQSHLARFGLTGRYDVTHGKNTPLEDAQGCVPMPELGAEKKQELGNEKGGGNEIP